MHTLTITRASEPRYGSVWLRSITLGAGGSFSPPVASPVLANGRRMLFIGDSYTAGAGNTGDASCKNTNPLNSNPLLAYGPVAARALRADYQVWQMFLLCGALLEQHVRVETCASCRRTVGMGDD